MERKDFLKMLVLGGVGMALKIGAVDAKSIEEGCCNVCGDNMTDETGQNLCGLSMEITIEHKETDKFVKTFGSNKVAICFTCWAKSLGIKPV